MAQAVLNCFYIDGKNADMARLIERSIEEIELPEGIKVIGSHALAYCSALKKLTLPEGVERIESYAVYRSALKELILPLSCRELIGYSLTMCNNNGLTLISFGDTKKIEAWAVSNNTKCLIYDFTRNTAVPTLVNSTAFSGINTDAHIFVPSDLYDTWIGATNWSALADYILPVYSAPVLPDPDYVSQGLEIVNGYVQGRGSCTDSVIVIPDECKGIDPEAFKDDNIIDTLILPRKSISVQYSTFDNSTLRVIKNYTKTGVSFTFSGAKNVKIISFIDGATLNDWGLSYMSASGITYDFTRCTSVVYMASTDQITVDSETKILVPLSLYSEWVEATNWTEFADYIYPAK